MSFVGRTPIRLWNPMIGKFLSRQAGEPHCLEHHLGYGWSFHLQKGIGLGCEMSVPFEKFAQYILERERGYDHARAEHCSVQRCKIGAHHRKTLGVKAGRLKRSIVKLTTHVGEYLNRLSCNEEEPQQRVASCRLALLVSLPCRYPNSDRDGCERPNRLHPGSQCRAVDAIAPCHVSGGRNNGRPDKPIAGDGQSTFTHDFDPDFFARIVA